MDRPRTDQYLRRRKRWIIIAATALALTGVTVVLARLKPVAPTVERNLVWIDTVKRGPMLRVAETQAKDIQIGQRASVDTRNGEVQGQVSRIDPSVQNGTVTVDITLTGELPRGARPDLSVEGTIERERLASVVFVGRPAFGEEKSKVRMFKLGPKGDEVARTTVQLGRSSVNTVEIVSGLSPGDKVILSDMSQWDESERIRLK